MNNLHQILKIVKTSAPEDITKNEEFWEYIDEVDKVGTSIIGESGLSDDEMILLVQLLQASAMAVGMTSMDAAGDIIKLLGNPQTSVLVAIVMKLMLGIATIEEMR